MIHDIGVVGAGIAGMATAARLEAAGLSTVVIEAHGQPGGCAGYFRRRGFSFDVGATTLVDFEPGGVGGHLLDAAGFPPVAGEALPGYVAWLPDRTVTLHRRRSLWEVERRTLGDSPPFRRFWSVMDRLADVFWRASRRGIRLPLRSAPDLLRAARAIGVRHLPLARYMTWTVGDLLARCGLLGERRLTGLLSMLVEDTVHSRLDEAPLINAALGITIRGAGLSRPTGGMRGFWSAFSRAYRRLGGTLVLGSKVESIDGGAGRFIIRSRRGDFSARQVVCAVPAPIAARIAPPVVRAALLPFVARDREAAGGAVIVFLGVPEGEVSGQSFTHHQILLDYLRPLGNGNNMFISVSAPGDLESAPPGHRAVMISTHCAVEEWEGLDEDGYQARKREIADRLVAAARRVYPALGEGARVFEVGTPRTYQRFTGRPRGAVGGVRQTLRNSNQHALGHDIGVPGFWMAGDSTWPGLGTVACTLGSRIVAESAVAFAPRLGARASAPAPVAEVTHAM